MRRDRKVRRAWRSIDPSRRGYMCVFHSNIHPWLTQTVSIIMKASRSSSSNSFVLVSLLVIGLCSAFSPVALRACRGPPTLVPTTAQWRLFMDEGEGASVEGLEPENQSEPEASSASDDVPDITALKKEIEQLEQDLKTKKSSLMYAQDQVEEYSKAGYARAVAEMENMRRVRLTMNSSSQSNAMAGILRNFLPLYDQLEIMKEKYANDEFGRQYGGLWIGPTFVNMGVKEYSVAAGDTLDRIRMNVVTSEYSNTAPKDTVIMQLSPGMELEGNVVRAASCVISRGNEEEPTSQGEAAPETSSE